MNRTNETWGIQYPGDFFPAMIIVSPITPHPAVALRWCSTDASAGSSWISLGAQTWVIIQLQISMKLVQSGLDRVTGNQERHRMNTASCQLCFYSRAGPIASECIGKDHPKSKSAGKNHKHKGHFLLLHCYLVASCRQKRQRCLKKGSFQLISLISSVCCQTTSWWLHGFQVPFACL